MESFTTRRLTKAIWNSDREFDSSDLVVAFQSGHFESNTAIRASAIAAAVDHLFAEAADDLSKKSGHSTFG